MTDREKLIETLTQTQDRWIKKHGVDIEELAESLIEARIVSSVDMRGLCNGTCELYVKGKGLAPLQNRRGKKA